VLSTKRKRKKCGYPTEPALSGCCDPNFVQAAALRQLTTYTVTAQNPPPPLIYHPPKLQPTSPIITSKTTTTTRPPPITPTAMSFLGFGKPQPTLAEKMAAAEQELEMITDMFNRFFLFLFYPSLSRSLLCNYYYFSLSHNNFNFNCTGSPDHATTNASQPITKRRT